MLAQENIVYSNSGHKAETVEEPSFHSITLHDCIVLSSRTIYQEFCKD